MVGGGTFYSLWHNKEPNRAFCLGRFKFLSCGSSEQASIERFRAMVYMELSAKGLGIHVLGLMWGFPKIGDPNIVPLIVGSFL